MCNKKIDCCENKKKYINQKNKFDDENNICPS